MAVTEISTKGKVVQVLGAVVDVEFPTDKLPAIYNKFDSSSRCHGGSGP